MSTRTPRDVARYFVRPQDESPGLTCLGYGTKFERFDCGPRTWPFFGAVLVTSGRGRLQSAATHGDLPIGPGTLLWQFPGVEHRYGPDGDGWRERWIVFDGPVAESFVELGFLDPANPVVRHAAHPVITRDLDQIEAVARDGGPLAPLLAGAHIHHLIVAAHQHTTIGMANRGAAARRGPNAPPGADDRSDALLARATAHLERAAFGPLDLAAVARAHGFGYSTFRRRFKAATGTSPKSYVLALRLARAKELLASTDRPVAEIARDVGFDDPYYFSRLFKDREARSPTAFRQDHRRG